MAQSLCINYVWLHFSLKLGADLLPSLSPLSLIFEVPPSFPIAIAECPQQNFKHLSSPMHCHALQKKVNQGNSVCSLLSFLPFWSDAEFFNVPLFDMKIPRETDSFSSRWCYAMCVWPLKGNSHHPHFYSRLLDSHNEVSFEVSFGLGRGPPKGGEI